MKAHALCAEQEHYAQAQRDFLRQRDEVFAAVEAHPDAKPWHLTRLAGFTDVDRMVWRTIGRVARVCLVVALPALFFFGINAGAGLVEMISVIALGLALGGASARCLFPHMVRSEHDRYPQGRHFERACVSQSEDVALAGLGASVLNWRRQTAVWVPDSSNDGLSLFAAITFGASFCFFVDKGPINWIIAAVRASTSTCC